MKPYPVLKAERPADSSLLGSLRFALRRSVSFKLNVRFPKIAISALSREQPIGFGFSALLRANLLGTAKGFGGQRHAAVDRGM